jgi:uncharacterized OB-fold protein
MTISTVDVAKRVAPLVTPLSEFFWSAGREGVLKILQCRDCSFYIHPPTPVCPRCLSRSVEPTPVSGRGRVLTYTVNYQAWVRDLEPFLVAIVELAEQSDLRLTTNIVDCELDAVEIDDPVQVTFVRLDEDVYLPVFRLVERGV